MLNLYAVKTLGGPPLPGTFHVSAKMEAENSMQTSHPAMSAYCLDLPKVSSAESGGKENQHYHTTQKWWGLLFLLGIMEAKKWRTNWQRGRHACPLLLPEKASKVIRSGDSHGALCPAFNSKSLIAPRIWTVSLWRKETINTCQWEEWTVQIFCHILKQLLEKSSMSKGNKEKGKSLKINKKLANNWRR